MVSGRATRAARLLYTRLGGTPRVSEIYSLEPWKAVERLTSVPLRYEVRFCRAPEDAAMGWLESTLSMGGEDGPKRTPLPRFQRMVIYRARRVDSSENICSSVKCERFRKRNRRQQQFVSSWRSDIHDAKVAGALKILKQKPFAQGRRFACTWPSRRSSGVLQNSNRRLTLQMMSEVVLAMFLARR